MKNWKIDWWRHSSNWIAWHLLFCPWMFQCYSSDWQAGSPLSAQLHLSQNPINVDYPVSFTSTCEICPNMLNIAARKNLIGEGTICYCREWRLFIFHFVFNYFFTLGVLIHFWFSLYRNWVNVTLVPLCSSLIIRLF